jgi:hypothetical protein
MLSTGHISGSGKGGRASVELREGMRDSMTVSVFIGGMLSNRKVIVLLISVTWIVVSLGTLVLPGAENREQDRVAKNNMKITGNSRSHFLVTIAISL